MNRYQQCIALMLFVEESKEVTLKAVLDHLYPKKKKISFSAVEDILIDASDGGLFSLRSRTTKKQVKFTENCLGSPDEYVLVRENLAEHEGNSVRQTQPTFLFEPDKKISEQHYYVDVKLGESTSLCGEKEGATTLYERIKQFTNYFASALCQKNYELVFSLFSKLASLKYNIEYLEKFIQKEEKLVDKIKFYDFVEVCEIYNGEITDPDVDLMRIPKGAKKHERAGITQFRLVYGHTPNGIPIFWQDVQLRILEEEGRFKVFDMRCVN